MEHCCGTVKLMTARFSTISAGFTQLNASLVATAITQTGTMFTKTRRRLVLQLKPGIEEYKLTFCVRVMSPECHHWKPAVQAAAVMLRTPAVDGQSPASQPRPLAIYMARNVENASVTCWSLISNARAPRVN